VLLVVRNRNMALIDPLCKNPADMAGGKLRQCRCSDTTCNREAGSVPQTAATGSVTAAAVSFVHCIAGMRDRGAENAIQMQLTRKDAEKTRRGWLDDSWKDFLLADPRLLFGDSDISSLAFFLLLLLLVTINDDKALKVEC
jgi:hypothetical protein